VAPLEESKARRGKVTTVVEPDVIIIGGNRRLAAVP
jgi:hypothetical protein